MRLQTLVRLARLGERGAREGLAGANAELGRREQQQQTREDGQTAHAAPAGEECRRMLASAPAPPLSGPVARWMEPAPPIVGPLHA